MPCDPPHTHADTHRQMHILTLPLTHLSDTQTTLSYTHAHSPTRVNTLTYMTALFALTCIHTIPHACSYTSQIQSHTSMNTCILCHPTYTVSYFYSITCTYSHILLCYPTHYTYPVHIHSHKSMLSHTCALRLPYPHLHAVPHTYTHTIP